MNDSLMHYDYQSRQDTIKAWMHLIAFSYEAASDGNLSHLIRMHHAYCVCIAIYQITEHTHTIRPSHIIHVTLFPRSFRGFWLNANNSECFIYQQCNGLA
ncbi:hypothetical protein LK413_05080 [Prevotella melaninogenica]|uniref:hypothetical protein n=1 Tax=Prevotella melaninogenica TaxID=28132 RepID=UPI001D15DA2A|nr:hypothetical protein [Prevotella melaninogenica]UEA98981.1 hypothetical protein LK413_05080 [Prevotella melaninogenica]